RRQHTRFSRDWSSDVCSSDLERIAQLIAEKDSLQIQLQEQEVQWQKEAEKVKEIHALQKQIEDDFHARNLSAEAAKDPRAPKALTDDELTTVKQSLHTLREELAQLQGETPMIQVNVNSQAIAEVVANWTGIPVGKMVSNEIKAVLDLQDVMGERVIGQPHALEAIAQSIRTSRAGLTDPRK